MSAINTFAAFICDAPRGHQSEATTASRDAFVDTIACVYAGCEQPVARAALKTFQSWGSGEAIVVARQTKLAPPFAALTNAAAAHALDFDDYDACANSHPSAVIFPALLAMAASRPTSGMDILDAHIVGVEILQRLGEAMNMDHYLRGWHTTVTLGSIAAAAACARLARHDHATTVTALSLGASMASGLTNQSGFTAKQLHAGLAAKNGVMAAGLAEAGITASDAAIDGPVSLANVMSEHNPRKFEAALAKLGNPWAIVEHGLITKPYPSCGYSHRLIDAAIDLVQRHHPDPESITAINMSVPDFYLDLLVYAAPRNSAEAMFSAHYNVAATLAQGRFDLCSLSDESIADAQLQRLCACASIEGRAPMDLDLPYNPADPDVVEITLTDGTVLRSEVALPTGIAAKPMSDVARRVKFNQCVRLDPDRRGKLWDSLLSVEFCEDMGAVLSVLR